MFLLSTYPKDHKVHQLDAHSDNCKRLMVGNGHGFRVVPIQKSGFVLFQPSPKVEIFLLIKSLGQAIFFFFVGGGGVGGDFIWCDLSRPLIFLLFCASTFTY